MHGPASKEDEEQHTGVEPSNAPSPDPAPQEEYSNVLERKRMTKNEFNWLWVDVLVQAFCMSFEIQVTYGISGFVNAYFQATSLHTALSTVQAIIYTSLVPLYTKVSDVFGRALSLSFAFLCYLVGLTVEGSVQSFEHLAVGQIVYSLGSTGVQALSQVVIADTTSLLTRGFMFAMYDVGTIANIWISQALIDLLTLGRTNRTAFGSLMVIFMLKFMGNVAWQYLTQYFVGSRDLTSGNASWLVRGDHIGWLVFQLIAAFLLKRYKKARPM
ncbi:hypothetical protein BGZ73_000790, partial [Actinomortierella ambigua]